MPFMCRLLRQKYSYHNYHYHHHQQGRLLWSSLAEQPIGVFVGVGAPLLIWSNFIELLLILQTSTSDAKIWYYGRDTDHLTNSIK